MKNNQNSNKSIRKRLTLAREQIIQLSPLKLRDIQGASYDSCGDANCTKPQ